MHQHLGLNLDNPGSSSGLHTSPGTQQQLHGQPQQQWQQHQQQPQQQQQQPPCPGVLPPLVNDQGPLPAGNPTARDLADGGPAQPPAPAARAPPPLPGADFVKQQAAELTALHTQLVQLVAVQGGNPPHVTPHPVPPVLFADPEAVDRARAAAATAREANKKPPLPDIVPGFKANALDIRECLFTCSRLTRICAICTLAASAIS